MEHIGIVHKIIPKPNHHMRYVAWPGVENDVSKTSNGIEIDTLTAVAKLECQHQLTFLDLFHVFTFYQ